MIQNDTGASQEQDSWQRVNPAEIAPQLTAAISEKRLSTWSLVLRARGVPHDVQYTDEGAQLLVPASELPRARNELRLYERKNRNWPPPQQQPETTLADNTWSTISILLLLAVFHNLTHFDLGFLGPENVNWLNHGNADAALIRRGEWWRIVTALTLHSDWPHLLGNLLIGGFFIVRLCREIGSGPGWVLLILSGALGNLINALLQPTPHRAVGFSTAVFAAVGILVALSLKRRTATSARRALLPVAAGLALLAMLGTGGENTDLGAHLFGFATGLGLGILYTRLPANFRNPGPAVNALLVTAALLTPVCAWWLALTYGP